MNKPTAYPVSSTCPPSRYHLQFLLTCHDCHFTLVHTIMQLQAVFPSGLWAWEGGDLVWLGHCCTEGPACSSCSINVLSRTEPPTLEVGLGKKLHFPVGSHCDNTGRLETHGHTEPGWGGWDWTWVQTLPLGSSRLFALPAAAGCGPGGGGREWKPKGPHDSFLGLLSLDSVKGRLGPVQGREWPFDQIRQRDSWVDMHV